MSDGHYCDCGDVCDCDGTHQCDADESPAYADDFSDGMPYCDVCHWFHDPYDGHARLREQFDDGKSGAHQG